jgi:hypothetical protein
MLLKSCADYVSVPLSYLFNQPMVVGVFPEGLKYSKVKPLYKKKVKNHAYLITDQFHY